MAVLFLRFRGLLHVLFVRICVLKTDGLSPWFPLFPFRKFIYFIPPGTLSGLQENRLT